MKNFETLYIGDYFVNNNCLYEICVSSKGTQEKKLCNFAPWLVREITVDDGAKNKTHITLSGIHEDGRTLPEIEIPSEELASFNWLCNSWGIDCILEPGKNTKDHLRHAIQTTAHQAERTTVYTVTGWREINGQWFYLMPGDDQRTVSLPGKMRCYGMERHCDNTDVSAALSLLDSPLAPAEILYPMMAFAFLSPLNHFLKLADHEPKFVLFLVGKTGSRKSTLAALFLSFFGRFTGAELPLSFRDTANSILENTFSLKDVLTCIDDFHPAGYNEKQKLTDTAQAIMRSYGDRTGRRRLRADSSPMDSHPPQGNAIITGEFPPDIGESGTARYFSLELGSNSVDLDLLTAFQRLAADGTFQRCMFGFTEWMRETWLGNPEHFSAVLKKNFERLRDEFRKSCPNCHGRVPETAAWLEIGMMMYLSFVCDRLGLERPEYDKRMEKLRAILFRLATQQADNITEDRPTHKFVRKLCALLESNTVCVLNKKSPPEFTPANCIGYEDDNFFYLYTEMAHKAVRKLCEEQGESFSLSSRPLLKALSEEGWLETADEENTKPVRIGKKTKRMMWLSKEKIRDAGMGMF